MIEFVQALSHRAQRFRYDRMPPAAVPDRKAATRRGKPLCHGTSAFFITVTILALAQRFDAFRGALVG